MFVLAFVTALIEIADGFKILKREYLAMVSKSQPSARGFIDLAGKASHARLEIMLKFLSLDYACLLTVLILGQFLIRKISRCAFH